MQGAVAPVRLTVPVAGAPIRLVLDTNIVISGLLWQGAPRRLIALASQDARIQLYASAPLINELHSTLGYRKFASRLADAGVSVDAAVSLYRSLVRIVTPAAATGLVPRDPKDDMVAATAITARAHAIVSGDKDLTELERISGIAVLRAIEAIDVIEGGAEVAD